MLHVRDFTFNPYQENTYLIYDDEGTCAIIDPGCYTSSEQERLVQYIAQHNLKPVLLLNTHGHVDHMLGNQFVKDTYSIPFHTHEGVIAELEAVPAYAAMFGLSVAPSPLPDHLLNEGDTVQIGDEKLEVLFTPGHSAGHISFFHRESDQLFSGDVLFQNSIGRVDLPGGNYETLMQSIIEKLLPLGNDVVVYPGHGPATTIGEEYRLNPFIRQYLQR
ncbi:MAG: MBL fold metallo-hydrolase [Bacteroidota bacterium]